MLYLNSYTPKSKDQTVENNRPKLQKTIIARIRHIQNVFCHTYQSNRTSNYIYHDGQKLITYLVSQLKVTVW